MAAGRSYEALLDSDEKRSSVYAPRPPHPKLRSGYAAKCRSVAKPQKLRTGMLRSADNHAHVNMRVSLCRPFRVSNVKLNGRLGRPT